MEMRKKKFRNVEFYPIIQYNLMLAASQMEKIEFYPIIPAKIFSFYL